jgi:hypothetical protein
MSTEDKARTEAERRYVGHAPWFADAFVAGAAWQAAQQPITVNVTTAQDQPPYVRIEYQGRPLVQGFLSPHATQPVRETTPCDCASTGRIWCCMPDRHHRTDVTR